MSIRRKASTTKNYDLDARALFLPMLRGYGNLLSLHIAMSLDNDGAGNLLDDDKDLLIGCL